MESSEALVKRFALLRGSILAWANVDEAIRIAHEDIAETVARFDPTRVEDARSPSCDPQLCSLILKKYTMGEGGLRLETHLSVRCRDVIDRTKQVLSITAPTAEAVIQYNAALEALTIQRLRLMSIIEWGYDLDPARDFYDLKDPWASLIHEALVRPYSRYGVLLQRELEAAAHGWEQGASRASVKTESEDEWPDLKSLALFLALRYAATKDKDADLPTDDVADKFAKLAGHGGKGSGHRLRGYFNSYHSEAGRTAKSKLNSPVLTRYNTVIAKLGGYPEALALAEKERTIVRNRSHDWDD